MTLERASELVRNATNNQDKYDLFSHFEELLNPYPTKINGVWNEQSVDWQTMFASLCGFLIATRATKP